MRLLLRPRFTALLWAVSLLAVLTVACAPDVEPPPSGATLVHSGPADPAAQPPAGARQMTPASPEPATPVPVARATATAPTVAQVASPVAASGDQRATTEATFLVSNTLGRGMALRSSPVSREPGKLWPDGTRMKGLGAEQDAYGWTWRWVRDPDGNVGWMPSNYLIQDSPAPAPAGNSKVQAPSAPPTLILVPTRGVPEVTPAAGQSTPTAGPATPTGSPAPARQNASAPQNATAPQADGLINSLRGVTSGAGSLPSGLPAMFGGR